jgi:hypothetical protein
VQGVCHAVTVITSGQMIFRPAPHMPVKSLHWLQNPSRMETWSCVVKRQSGHVQVAAPRFRRKSPRLGAVVAVMDALEELLDIIRPFFAHWLGAPVAKLQ